MSRAPRRAGTRRDSPGAGAARSRSSCAPAAERAGLLEAGGRGARPEDLVVSVDADSGEIAAAVLAAAHELLLARRRAGDGTRRPQPRALDSALRMLPGANLAAISVPGPYAGREAMRARRRGLHVFLFSDNVPLAAEVALKREARRRGLLCMGPDCGTAYIRGVGLGFANVVDRGRIGCVTASGTRLQAVACHLAARGERPRDPQGLEGRIVRLEAAGVEGLPSNAEAARFAALLLQPELAVTLLGPAA